jgi:hypothetical protein
MIVEPFSVNRQLVGGAIENCLRAVIRIVSDYLGGRSAFLKVAVCTMLLSLLTAFPEYWKSKDHVHPTIRAILAKIQHPLSPIPPDLKDREIHDGVASHIDKLELRLTIPILGRLFRTGPWTVIVFSHLSALGVFYLLASLASKALHDNVGGALFVLGLGPTFFGSWFLNDFWFGDGIAFFFLLLSIASGNLLVSSGSFVAAAFCDERCVAALPLLCLYLVVSLRHDTQKTLLLKRCIAIIVGLAMWVVLRSWIASAFHLPMGTSLIATREVLRVNFTKFPGMFLGIFKASWALPIFGFVSLLSLRKWAMASAFLGVFVVALAPSILVADVERSVCYTFIILLMSIHFLRDDRHASREYLAAILLLNLVFISPGISIVNLVNWWFQL